MRLVDPYGTTCSRDVGGSLAGLSLAFTLLIIDVLTVLHSTSPLEHYS